MKSKAGFLLMLTAVLTSPSIALSPGSVLAATPFVLETVDAVGNVGDHCSLALDARRNPHVSYHDLTNTSLKYAVKSGGTWYVETVDESGSVGTHSSIAISTQGEPRISYYDGLNQALKYARKSGDTWLTETVEAGGFRGQYTSLALDALGNPHISYYDGGNMDLKYATKSGGVWSIETVDATGLVGRWTSIALDSNGDPHISYEDGTNDHLKYAVKSGGVWSIETADASVDAGRYSSLALDADDNPHISYVWSSNLRYAAKSGGVWSIELVEQMSVSANSLALDQDGTPHIAYADHWPSDALKYATKNGAAWSIESVDTVIVDFYLSIAVDDEGYPRIAYGESTDLDLKYADAALHLTSPVGGERWLAGSQQTVTWQGEGTIDIYVSQDGGAHYALIRQAAEGGSASVGVPAWSTEFARVKIIRDDPFSTSESPGVFSIGFELHSPWWTARVDAGGDLGWYSSLALDPLDNVHISYYDWTNGDLKYARKSGGGWSVETVEAAGNVGWDTSLDLDSQGNAHISYHHSDDGDLKYATNASGSWTTEVVDATATTVGWFTSIVVDDKGDVHISYYDVTNDDLKYAAKIGGVWSIEIVDDGGGVDNVGQHTSLAIDGDRNPHISYYDTTNDDVRYATKSNGVWAIEVVDQPGNVGRYSALALDHDDSPHISYFDDTHNDLKYATKSNGVWSIETIDVTGSVGWYSSIVVDAQGEPHIVYKEALASILKHATKSGVWFVETVAQVDALYMSIALDEQGNPRVSYYNGLDRTLDYASTAIEVTEPAPGTIWPVGAMRTVSWNGAGGVDLSLSVDGGNSFDLVASQLTGGEYGLTVPHRPSRFCVLKLERDVPQSVEYSDSFFTIETSVSLLSMMVAPAKEGGGNVVSWSTDPGPEDLKGYRLEKRDGPAGWLTIVWLTKETSHHDTKGSAGDSYRLFAVNGFGEELYLGETSDGNVPSFGGRLVAWPVPFGGGELNVSFGTVSVGGVPEPTEVAVYDVAGRHVRTIARGTFLGVVRRTTWDGRDESGKLVASGVYFIRAKSGMTQQTRKLVIVR